MLNKKGFTLIEIIVSIALIGIIAMAFLPSLSNHFKWIVDTKTNITQSAFDSQKEMEKNSKVIKELLSSLEPDEDIDSDTFDSMGITMKISEIKLFEDEYPETTYSNREYPDGYLIESKLNDNRKYVSFIGDQRLPELLVPEIEVKSLFFLKEDIEATGSFEYYDYTNLKIKSVSNMFKNPENSFNRYRHDWYVSKPGFIIPVPDVTLINEDFDMGRIYPSFPDDYIASPIVSELGSSYSYVSPSERAINGILLNNFVKQYPGRHYIYTITPFAKSLKMGNRSMILPLYVYGVGSTSNLVIHLDASTIDMSDTSIRDGLYLKTWKNNRPSIKNPYDGYDAKNKFGNETKPVLKTTDLYGNITPEIPFQGEGETARVWGRALGSNENFVSKMEISDINLNNNFSIFLIIRKVDEPFEPVEGSILSGLSGNGNESWSLSWDDDSRLIFEDDDEVVALGDTLYDNNWYLVQFIVNGSNATLEANSLKSGVDHNLQDDDEINLITTNSIDINWNGVEIAEILVYDKALISDLSTIANYLSNKYNPQ